MFNSIKDNELLSKFLSVFQPADSTMNQLVEIYDKIYFKFRKRKRYSHCFRDISQAFDSVGIEVLFINSRGYVFLESYYAG